MFEPFLEHRSEEMKSDYLKSWRTLIYPRKSEKESVLLAVLKNATPERKKSPSIFEQYFLNKSQEIFQDTGARFLNYNHELHPTGINFAWYDQLDRRAFNAALQLKKSLDSYIGNSKTDHYITIGQHEFAACKTMEGFRGPNKVIIDPDLWEILVPNEKTAKLAEENNMHQPDYEAMKRVLEDAARTTGEVMRPYLL